MARDTAPLTEERKREIDDTLFLSDCAETISAEQFGKNFTGFLKENKELLTTVLNLSGKEKAYGNSSDGA